MGRACARRLATQLTFASERILYASAAPDGARMIVGSDAGGNEHVQLALFDPATGALRPVTSDPAHIHSFGCWSPDGARIAFAANTRDPAFFDIYTLALDEEGAAPVCVYQQDGSNTAAAWAPDGSALIVSAADRSLNNNLYHVPLDGGRAPPAHAAYGRRRLSARGLGPGRRRPLPGQR